MVSKGENHQQLFDLLEKMLEYDPAKRLSLEQALQHPFFSSYRVGSSSRSGSSRSGNCSSKKDWVPHLANPLPLTCNLKPSLMTTVMLTSPCGVLGQCFLSLQERCALTDCISPLPFLTACAPCVHVFISGLLQFLFFICFSGMIFFHIYLCLSL